MAKSIALAADPSRLASLLLSYIQGVCAFVAPRQPGASAAIIDRLSHSRALRGRIALSPSRHAATTADPTEANPARGRTRARGADSGDVDVAGCPAARPERGG